VKPRYESDLSFRVAGKAGLRRVDVGRAVKQGDILATLDTQDYQNQLRSAEADVGAARPRSSRRRAPRSARQAVEERLDAEANYDTALRNLRAAEAKLAAAKANLDLTRDQLNYTELKADFDGVITAVGAEAGQNVTAGQMVVKLARPTTRTRVFNIAETRSRSRARDRRSHRLAAVQPGPDRRGCAGDPPVADPRRAPTP
jgi:RND family efflux transporter MFP subunit